MRLFLSESRPLRITTLCALYAAQGMPDGFVRTGLKTYLIAEGASTAAVGHLVALVSWPWALKWLWGPVVDRYSNSPMGRRRPWVLAAQFGMGLTLTSLLLIPELSAGLRILSLSVLMINCFAALQDVAVDALAIDVLPERERGVANGLMFGASYLGSFIGGGVLGGILLIAGLPTAVSIELLILAGIGVFPLLVRERPGDAFFKTGVRTDSVASPEASSVARMFLDLRAAFAKRSAAAAALLAILSLIPINAHLVFWPVHLQRTLGWSGERYLLLEGAYSVIFGLVGSILGGVVASWIGAKRSVAISMAALGFCWAIYAISAASWHNVRLVTLMFLAGAALAGFLQVSLFSLFMGVCSKSVAASQFSAYMALLNLSNGLGAMLAGYATTTMALPLVFAGMACFQLALIVVVLPITIDESRVE